ncbi:NUDIX family hydrolase [Halorhabdus sp. SVX81]|uniref:NUDIX hydrolase n=1 Tax=Halorhabdus sp. SVX81 TaxID=2978283 RepID=UPI0023DAA25B|nr:NUDIX domain-containing protein [Halorhabdus sp. SVX81]WEL17248.1 NUDIX family hydrolase [Halorhabdus sp. SVX81]
MTVVDDLWYRADVAEQEAEQTYHRLLEDRDDVMEFTRTRYVSRPRFETITERIQDNGLPYGAHTVVYRDDGALLLVRHDAVGKWVLPGGEVGTDETFREAARRELTEEAGIEAAFTDLALLGRVQFYCNEYETWGVLPIYEGRATETTLTVEDPDGEITDAEWFTSLPEDTRDRDVLVRFRDHELDG